MWRSAAGQSLCLIAEDGTGAPHWGQQREGGGRRGSGRSGPSGRKRAKTFQRGGGGRICQSSKELRLLNDR
eukprot:3385306-Pyramimonas_sp.AAC.1